MSLEMPKPGTKVARRHNGKQETRWVIDSTYGNDVVFIVGRWSRIAAQGYGLRCSLAEWHEWAGTPGKDGTT